MYPDVLGPGWVLDVTTSRWVELSPNPDPAAPPGVDAADRTLVAAGTDLFVFGGSTLGGVDPPQVHATAYLWRPPL